jgi:hypothetical protein
MLERVDLSDLVVADVERSVWQQDDGVRQARSELLARLKSGP